MKLEEVRAKHRETDNAPDFQGGARGRGQHENSSANPYLGMRCVAGRSAHSPQSRFSPFRHGGGGLLGGRGGESFGVFGVSVRWEALEL